MAWSAKQGLAHSSVKSYLAAVRHSSIVGGWGDLGMVQMPRLELTLRGLKRVQAEQGRQQRERRPITVEILLKIRRVWQKQSGWKPEMLWAASSLCFFGFFRSGELTVPAEGEFDEAAHLGVRDVMVNSWEDPQWLKIRLRASKTDPFRQGVDIYVGMVKGPLCPVAAVLAYLVGRGLQQGPLFLLEDGKGLTRARFVLEVKAALEEAGMDETKYSGHSFRIGAATTSVQQGLGDATVQMLGRWRSGANKTYVRTPREQLAGFSRRLAAGIADMS